MTNKALLVLFCVLLGTAYWFEEYRPKQVEIEEQRRVNLFDYQIADLEFLELTHIRIEQKESRFLDAKNRWPISQTVLKLMFERLGSLRVKRVIDSGTQKNFSEFIPSDAVRVVFGFKQGEVVFSLGNKLSVDESFYVLLEQKNKRDLLQVIDSSILETVYTPEERYRSDKKYLRIKSLLSIPREFFWDKTLRQKDFELTSVHLDNQRNRAFSVFFNKKGTSPEKLDGIPYNLKFIENYGHEVNHLQAHELHLTPDFSQLREKMAELQLLGSDNQSEVWKLYRGYRGQTGYFIKTSNEQALYEVQGETARLFFLNVQDFWDKKVWPEGHPLTQHEEVFTMSFNDKKQFSISLPSSEGLLIQMHGEDQDKLIPNYETWKSLLTLLTGTGEWQQAHRVSPLGTTELNQLVKVPQFDLNFRNSHLKVLHKGDELLILNLTKKLKWHYLVGKENPFGFKMHDFFYVK